MRVVELIPQGLFKILLEHLSRVISKWNDRGIFSILGQNVSSFTRLLKLSLGLELIQAVLIALAIVFELRLIHQSITSKSADILALSLEVRLISLHHWLIRCVWGVLLRHLVASWLLSCWSILLIILCHQVIWIRYLSFGQVWLWLEVLLQKLDRVALFWLTSTRTPHWWYFLWQLLKS